MTNHASTAHGHAGEHPDHGGLGKYLAVFGALLMLTIISFAVANSSLMNTPAVGWVIMMAISCAKAFLVIAFFMHMIWEANWKYVLTIPASIMSCFLVLMLVPDIGFRTRHYTTERLRHAAPAVLGERSVTHTGDHHGPELPFTAEDLKKRSHEEHDHETPDAAKSH
ncbi:MAG TPA: cytochrome C oxidase subunit IV family protein [Pirellulaceae bacterium]|nr:cytochrome C oxidase subunit IV family protein [Pirellulaceae bacterium]